MYNTVNMFYILILQTYSYMYLCDYHALSPHGHEYLLVQLLYLHKTVLYVHIRSYTKLYIGFMNFNKNILISYKHAACRLENHLGFHPNCIRVSPTVCKTRK